MTGSASRTADAVVVGGNLCGLVTAWQLGQLGFRTVLLERSPRLGGVNASFTTADGSTFDIGMHVLDYMRSEVTTRLFTRLIGGRVHKVRLQRGMILRGHHLPYNPAPAELPDELRTLLPGDRLIDDIGDQPPTRERLRRVYGSYADFVLDEVLPSYRCEVRHRDLGVEESRLLANIYPWFFPRAERREITEGESRAFHDRLRRGEEQYILYPQEHGFSGFARAIEASLPDTVEVVCGVPDLQFELEPGTHTVRHARVNGGTLTANRWFWCARWPGLCKVLDLPTQNLASDNLLLGSFTFNEPAVSDFNEILVGDAACHMDRISFPGKFATTDAPQLQVEFAFPVADDSLPLDQEFWQERWLENLRQLGLIGDGHELRAFDFRHVRMNFNSFGAEGEARVEADPSLIRDDSNVWPVAPTLLNRNLNGSVPLWLQSVAEALATRPV